MSKEYGQAQEHRQFHNFKLDKSKPDKIAKLKADTGLNLSQKHLTYGGGGGLDNLLLDLALSDRIFGAGLSFLNSASDCIVENCTDGRRPELTSARSFHRSLALSSGEVRCSLTSLSGFAGAGDILESG